MLLLPAMVSLSPAVAKEVLRVISLGKDEVRRLTNRSDVPNEKSEGSSKIRKCYLHFLMAFLVDKEANTIQLVMAKEGKFFFIFFI
jgi:Ribosome 60S biogenesis N-terminal